MKKHALLVALAVWIGFSAVVLVSMHYSIKENVARAEQNYNPYVLVIKLSAKDEHPKLVSETGSTVYAHYAPGDVAAVSPLDLDAVLATGEWAELKADTTQQQE